MVVEATYETLANPRLIDKLATLILNAHQQKMADASVINIIAGQLHDTEKALSNLIACMEKGIVSASTAKRLEELEQQKTEFETKLALEKAKETIPIDKKDIIDYLQQAIRKTPRLMIELLIKDVILYKDRIEIHFNYTDLIRPDADKRQAFLFYNFSKKIEIKHSPNFPIEKKTIAFEMYI